MHLSLSVGVELTLENSAIVPEGPFKQLKVDLLGNNIVKAFFLNEEYYVTALEPERIIRAMCFRKTNFGHILNPAVRLAAQAGVALGKCSNMMLSGAWVTYTYEQ